MVADRTDILQVFIHLYFNCRCDGNRLCVTLDWGGSIALDFTSNFSVGEVCPRLGKDRRLKTFQCLFVCPLQRECGVYLDPFTAGASTFSEQTYMPANETFSAGNQTFF